jgi:16S rRNA (uracil1498-N3)-methyltransferase
VVERGGGAAVIAIHLPSALPAPGESVQVDGDAANHLRVRRVAPGAPVVLLDGRGGRATGTLVELHRGVAQVQVTGVTHVAPPAAIHLFVPVGDRDRMMWLGEKAVELGVARWTPVMFQRSRSVSPRGEGESFDRRLAARMQGALEQSGGAWLPVVDACVEPDALVDIAARTRLLLDAAGEPVGHALDAGAPVAIALGPEGGMDPAERQMLLDAGWCPVSLAPSILRFETAALAAVAVVRAHLSARGES